MPDTIDETGLTISTLEEVKTQIITDFQAIYGSDINVDQNSPDGQIIGIIAQAAIDIRELLVEINAGFDPDQAVGTILDQRVSLNNIARNGGTYTIEPITITVDRTVNLEGLDDDFNNPDGTGFTVQDNAGNQFILIDSATLTVGSHVKNFRAKTIGKVETTVGTIQTQSTVIIGVTAINNASGSISVGADEETDAELRVRRQQSVALTSTGYLNGLQAAFLSLDGVSEAKVYENYTNATDADGIPPHGLWCIVEGGSNDDIAQVIYNKKSYGSNMKGDVTVSIDTPSGGEFVARFDRPTAENLYIRFDIQPVLINAVFDQDAIKQTLIDDIFYNVGDYSETSSLTALALNAINVNGGGGVPVNMEISINDADWFDYLDPSTKDKQFVVDVSRVAITEL